jgi:glycosyltransferase involved in cell wall biosynthesis
MSAKKINEYKFEKVWILVPCFNEGKVVKNTLNELSNFFNNILVVDDGSTDNTYDILCSMDVTIVRHPINLGQGAAIDSGFKYLLREDKSKCVITFDADGQHSIKDAVSFAGEITSCKEDVILGSRFINNNSNVPFLKKIALKLATHISNLILGLKLTDTHNGMKAFKIKCLRQINIQIDGYGFESELISKIKSSGISYKEMPTEIIYSDYSMKKGQSLRNGLRIIESLFLLFFKK